MGWFWKSKSKKENPEIEEVQEIEEVALPTVEETLQAEIDQLRDEHSAALTLQAELKESLEGVTTERDSIRSQSEQALSELNRKKEGLETTVIELQQKIQLLDEANVGMAEMVRKRDEQIETIQKAGESELKEHESQIQLRDQQLKDKEAELAGSASKASAQISDLTAQLAKTKEDTAATTRELEERLAADSARAATQLAELKQQLAESEIRSANRAEQRSALLRNMIEIHRLSTTSAKSEPAAESLKLVSPGWSEQANKPPETSEADPATPNQFYSRSSTWNEKGESESA